MQGKIPQKVTYRVTKKHPDVLAKLAAIGKKIDRSRNFIMERAFVEYINRNKK